MILTGQYDLKNCAGNCNGILQHPTAEYFNHSSAFEAVVHPGSAHGINFHFNTTGAYGAMMDLVAKNVK